MNSYEKKLDRERVERLSRETEAWLQSHDPGYERRDWGPNTPGQEIPGGDPVDMELLVYGPKTQRYVASTGNRACGVCGSSFLPLTNWQRFCSKACKQRDYRRRVTQSQKEVDGT